MNTLREILLVTIIIVLAWGSILSITDYFRSRRPTPQLSPQSINWEILKQAIADVESGDNPDACSSSGARTRYQIHPNTWRRFSTCNIRTASPGEIDRVVEAIFNDIQNCMAERGEIVDVYSIAAYYNAGPHAKCLSVDNVDYASRVEALYRDLCKT